MLAFESFSIAWRHRSILHIISWREEAGASTKNKWPSMRPDPSQDESDGLGIKGRVHSVSSAGYDLKYRTAGIIGNN